MASSTDDLSRRLTEARDVADKEVQKALDEAGGLPMYDMLRYFMGYENPLKTPSPGMHGKRTRSALLLLIAEMFGGSKSAPVLAAGIELFHNFTLIHDDIEDGDEMRRGQPTVWKEWGINHGINAGDAQTLLVDRCLLRASGIDSDGHAAAELMNETFLGVIEGQYLDFELTEQTLGDATVTEEAYLEMIRKKTAILIGVAVAAGGRSAGTDETTTQQLFTYGESLGMAYQMTDDLVSIWADEKTTGKAACGDIYERKKTFPILYARDNGAEDTLLPLYAEREPLTEGDVAKIVTTLEGVGAKEATVDCIISHIKKATGVAMSLPINQEDKDLLAALAEKIAASAGIVQI